MAFKIHIKARLLLIALYLFFAVLNLHSQARYEDLKSALIVQFARNITWQDEELFTSFNIGFFGQDTSTFEVLNASSSELRIKNVPVVLHWIKELKELSNIQVIYIDKYNNHEMEEIVKEIENKQILLITEQCNDLKDIMLNIVYDERKEAISFEINKTNIVLENLGIEPELLILGGTEIDVRELYKKVKEQLTNEKKNFEQQRIILENLKNQIEQKNLNINALNEKIDEQQDKLLEVKQNLDSLYIAEIRNSYMTRRQENTIETQKSDIEKQKVEIERQKVEIEIQKAEMEIQKSEMDQRSQTLNNLSHEIGEKQKKIEQQTSILKQQDMRIRLQNQLLYFTVAITLLLLALGYTIFRAYRIKKNTNEELELTNREVSRKNKELEKTLQKLKDTQSQLIQSEKMASLGVLIAGVAHEINNPINFINSGIYGLKINLNNLLKILDQYQNVPINNPGEKIREVRELEKKANMATLLEIIPKMISNIEVGIQRSTEIVRGLGTFARSDENIIKQFDIHENIDNTLLLLFNQYKGRIEIVKNYGKVPLIECYPGQINQVFMNILSNAIQAIQVKGDIIIKTWFEPDENKIGISIKDNGKGIPDGIREKIFDPFFTTKEVGKGTGLGLSITYGIIVDHQGKIKVDSKEGKGTDFTVLLPIKQ